MRVADLYTPDPVTATPDTTILEAAAIMRDKHVGDIIVVEERGDIKVPLGIITDRDIVVGVLARDVEHINQLLIGDVISGSLVTTRETDLVSTALKRMRAQGVRRMPVVDGDGVLIGILTMDDVLDLVTQMLEDIVVLMGRGAMREEEVRS